MSCGYVEIKTDQAVKLRVFAINENSLLLDFKFFKEDGAIYNITNNSYTFSITSNDLTTQYYHISNALWLRPAVNEIRYTIPNLNLAKGSYKIDFTCTYQSGIVQTVADGELIVRDRYIV